MPVNEFERDEIAEYAALLYGPNWRSTLAENLNITRKQLVMTLASDDPVPEYITVPFISLIEKHLYRQTETMRKIENRLQSIRGQRVNHQQP